MLGPQIIIGIAFLVSVFFGIASSRYLLKKSAEDQSK